MNPVGRLAAQARAAMRLHRAATAIGAAVVVVIAGTGVALAALGRQASSPPAPVFTTPSPSATQESSGAGPFTTVSPAPAVTYEATPSASPTPSSSPTPSPAVNVLAITNLVPDGLDATVGRPLCFSHPIGEFSVSQVGRSYAGQIMLQDQQGGTWTDMPLDITPLQGGSPRIYLLTPHSCFTFTAPSTAGTQYQVWQLPDRTPSAAGSITIRVDAVGVDEVPPTLLWLSPRELHEQAGVPADDLTGVNGCFQDGTGDDQDLYTGYVDWGDGTPVAKVFTSTGPGGKVCAIVGGSHTWPRGTFTLTLHLIDADGGETTATLPVIVD